jgi:Flp pilus assembly protein TadD
MRAAIARIRETHPSEEARNLAKLAASYLLAGDVETARRYLERVAALS